MNQPEDKSFRDNDTGKPANPFHSPPDVRGSEFDLPAGVDAVIAQSPGSVRQVRAVAICMIIHGVLIGLVGVYVVGMAFFFANMSSWMPPEEAEAMEAMEPMQFAMGWGFGIFGVIIGLIGLLSIYAGIRNVAFRGRTLGVVMLGVGVVTSFTCYCAPTAIGLAVWGLIIYLNPSVSRAFAMVEEGASVQEILAMVRKPGT